MSSRPAIQMWLPLNLEGEVFRGDAVTESPSEDEQVMERVVEKDNLIRALKQVRRNGGSPGTDGMTVEGLGPYLKDCWPRLKVALLEGSYAPQPVKRVEIPKPGGGVRKLGIPTVVDRFIQQAILQVLRPEWDQGFSEFSFGFRPGRSAHQAIGRAQKYLKEGYTWVVDLDLEKFFETSSYCTPFHERLSKRVGCAPNTLIRKPFRFPERRWTAESSPRFTRCNTVCRETPRTLVASSIGR
jgi:RNA-directed DNA polymerase